MKRDIKTIDFTDNDSTSTVKTIIFENKSENWNNKKNTNKKSKKERIKELYQKYKLLKKENYNKLSFVKPKEIWVRYYNKKTFDLNKGGFLMKYDEQNGVIKLMSLPYKNIYCIKLEDVILFIPKNIEISKYKSDVIEMYIENKIKSAMNSDEYKIKEKLYKLYKENRLVKKV